MTESANAAQLEALTKLAQALNLAMQDAQGAASATCYLANLLVFPMIGEIAEMEKRVQEIIDAINSDNQTTKNE